MAVITCLHAIYLSQSAQQVDTDDPGDNPSSLTAGGPGDTDGVTDDHCEVTPSSNATADRGDETSSSTACASASTDGATDDCGNNGDIVVQDATVSLTANANVITRDTHPDIQSSPVMSEGGGNVPDASEDNRSSWPKWMQRHIPMIENGPGVKDFQLVLKKFLMFEALLGYPQGQVASFSIPTMTADVLTRIREGKMSYRM